ncbi:DNA mismatch repair endonuclease MutL [Patescibacteria group bacterium]|nr:DNA mismatch repair endonuclease MutL [Patescibacteria group bacterium]
MSESRINILAPHLVSQIAAGEVVERPASVVKELVENSIDAGAKNIVMEIENGGLNLIKIVDDGIGMNREDAEKSIIQHATSKLSNESDLYKISTLGFRGEALASISAVSEFELLTKDDESVAGTSISVKSNEVCVNDAGCAKGTSISVKNLFYNIPARKKYLKTAITEFNHIVDLFFNYCLAFPEISWKLMHNNKVIYHFPPAAWIQRINDVLGEEIIKNLLQIDLKLNGIVINGYIGRPQISRNNRKLQFLFINNRPVNEFVVSKQIKDAYSTLISKDLYPVYLLNLEIDPEKIDVNVHPRKLEVRFSEPQIIYRTMYQVVSRVLDENDLTMRMESNENKTFIPLKEVLAETQVRIPVVSRSIPPISWSKPVAGNNPFVPKSQVYKQPAALDFSKNLLKQSEAVPEVESCKILGQAQNSYIIVEFKEGIRIYDQHACSERIQYEKIKNQWQIGKLASQKKLLPETIELTPTEARLINDNQEVFERLGYDVSGFGGNTFVISAIPQFLINENQKEVILEIIGNLTESEILENEIVGPLDKIFKMMSCKSAIKFGQPLMPLEISALISEIESLPNHYTCVHGRPCVIEFSMNELEKMFKRK